MRKAYILRPIITLTAVFVLFIFSTSKTYAQCGNPNWVLSNDCGDIQASGGLAPNQPTIFCEGETVIVENNSSPVSEITTTYIDWDDGVCEEFSGCPPTFSHAFDFPNDTCINGGQVTFMVRLAIEKNCGTHSSFNYITFPIAVRFKPIAQALVSQALVCTGEEVDFNNNSCANGNAQYQWNINGDIFTSENVPAYVFSNPGDYNVTLTVSNSCGSDDGTVMVAVSQLSVAYANASVTQACAPDTVFFTNLSQGIIGQTWTVTPATGWAFANGTDENSSNPAIAFNSPGTYTVTMSVVGCGYPEWVKVISILQSPVISIAPIPDACDTGMITILPKAIVGVGTPYVNWLFPGGTPGTGSGANPGPVSYSGQGSYIAVVSIFASGCGTATDADTFNISPLATAAFTLSDYDICGPDEIVKVINKSVNANNNYTWKVTPDTGFKFVNGTASNSPNPQLKFTAEGSYTISLHVNACGNPVAAQTLKVRIKPNVKITPTPDNCDAILTFYPDSVTAFTGGVPDSILWTFLNGSPSTFSGLHPPAVVFSDTGLYGIVVQASNVCGSQTASDTFAILKPAVISIAPVAPMCNNTSPVQLQATPAGNGWSGPGVSPSGLFDPGQVPGNLLNAPISLFYQTGSGSCLSKDTLDIQVNGNAVNVGPDTILCRNSGALVLAGMPSGGLWSGAGIVQGGVFDPAVAGLGDFTLVYVFTDSNTHCVNADTLVASILGAPEAALDSIKPNCINEILELGPFASAGAGNTCHWDFGDGTYSDKCNPVHIYNSPGSYKLMFMVENSVGCRDTAAVNLEILKGPDAVIELDADKGCADFPVSIANSADTDDFTTFYWNFGNGQTDTVQQPGTIVYMPGEMDTSYYITLIAQNQCGVAKATDTVFVLTHPQARFGTDISSGCGPLEVNFNNVSVGNTDFYQWYVNGSPAGDQMQLPQQVFTASGADSLYFISLVTGNFCGMDTAIHSVLVKTKPVDAFFNTDTLSGCPPLTVHFIDYTTQSLDMSWDFGDGTFAVGDSVSNTFEEAGEYLVREFVTNGCGDDTGFVKITVWPKPDLSFEHAPYGCQGDTLFLINTSKDLFAGYWDFGDGTRDSTTISPGHVYAQTGTYTISLTGMAGTTVCPATVSTVVEVKTPPVATAEIADSFGCRPFVLKTKNNSPGSNFYQWNFGNGANSTEKEPVYTYMEAGNFTLSLEVRDIYGCKDVLTFAPINVFPTPTARFAFNQSDLCATPAVLKFENQSMEAHSCVWDFGPLGSSNMVNPTLTVNDPTTILVTLAVESIFHCKDTVAETVKIYTKPVLDFFVEDARGCEPLTVLFENNSVGVNKYAWNFGDGTVSNEPIPLHVFEKEGDYHVTLYASMDSICFDSLTFSNMVEVFPSAIADFNYEEVTDTTVVPNGIIRFKDHSLKTTKWTWDFGDGATSNLRNPLHQYHENGARVVTLIASNSSGCADTIVKEIIPEDFGTLYVPNALSPELGEPGTRVFQPAGIGLIEYEMSVYASNGQRLWTSTRLTGGRPEESWDGTYNGVPMPQGLYWWKAKARFYNGRIWSGMRYDGAAPVTEGKVMLIR